MDSKSGERIAKVIARSGLCSRREAEALIGDRRVSVNGGVIESAALDILPTDTVLVDGRPLSVREPPRLWRYYKPKGRVTTHKDPEGRPTVFEALPENLPRLISVGRLDFNTEGLLLLTNDGDLARHLELPSTGWTRRYRVRAYGDVTEAQLQELAGGLTINKMSYGAIEASLEREQGDNVWISVSIREGKNREVRRIMEHLGLTVNRLIRISFGPFMLGDMEPGQIEEVKTAVLKDQLGPRLSRQLGVKREVPREERRLAPGRAKPTYLRRKPAAEARPERMQPETRLKRRRVFLEEGADTPAVVEYVAERVARKDRFQGPAKQNINPHESRNASDRDQARPRRREDAPRRSPEKFSRPSGGAGEARRFGERPFPRSEREDGSSAFRAERGERKPWKAREENAQPALDKAPERSRREPREFDRFKKHGEVPRRDRPGFQPSRLEQGETKRPQRRFESAGKPTPLERTTEGRPMRGREEQPGTRRLHKRPEGAASRFERREKRPDRSEGREFRRERDGGRRPFMSREAGQVAGRSSREERPGVSSLRERPGGDAPGFESREKRRDRPGGGEFRRERDGERKPFKSREAGRRGGPGDHRKPDEKYAGGKASIARKAPFKGKRQGPRNDRRGAKPGKTEETP